MMRLFLLFPFFMISNFALAQEQTRQLEIFPFIRQDKYPQFSYVLNGRPSTDYVNIKGTSFGVSVYYKIPITKSVLLKAGTGFYEYSFDKINKNNTLFGHADARDIGFISPYYISFYTNGYRYNTITANIGIEKIFKPLRNMEIVTGANLNNYFAFSEYYHLSYNPGGGLDYRQNNKGYFGSSFNLNICILKRFQKLRVGPSVIIPVFDLWKMDKIFPEETNFGSRNKWMNGIGLGISINYSLIKKLK